MGKSRQYAIEFVEVTAMNKDAEAQLRKFQDLARELECDEDEAAFDEKLKRIAKVPKPTVPEPKGEA